MVKKSISRLLYYVVLFYYNIFYPLVSLFSNICFVKKVIFPQFYIKNALRLASFNGFLRTDLEFLDALGQLRAEISKCNKEWVEQNNFKPANKIKIGFFGVFGREANFSKEFFTNHPDNVEVYLYDLIRPMDNNYTGTDIFDGYKDLTYRKTPSFNYWEESTKNYDKFLNMIGTDKIDVFFNITGSYILPLFDKCNVAVLLHTATTQIHLAHPKFIVQGFVQPPWPYKVIDGKIFNIKAQKHLNSFYAKDDGLMFNLRGATKFERKNLEEKTKQIFFMGNLIKLAQPNILDILYELLIADEKITFVYYGKGEKYQKIINSFFAKYNLINQVNYKGAYTSQYDKDGNLIDDGNVYNAYNDLMKSRLFFNTYPRRATRSCFEAYHGGVAVVHLDLDDDVWLEKQSLNPYKGPMVLTKLGKASTVEEYKKKCIEILKDDKVYYDIIEEQDDLIQNVTDTNKMWEKVFFMIKKDQELKNNKKEVNYE